MLLVWYMALSCNKYKNIPIIFMKKVKAKKYKKKIAILEERIADMEERYTSVHDMMQMTSSHMREIQQNLEKSNKHILDSINYALRIQQAMLDSEAQANHVFPDNFVYYVPKDILSGDLYWFKRAMGIPFAAAIDCTGHGVPAAMLTVLALSLLNQIVTVFGITDPSEILIQLDSMIWHYTHNDGKKEQIKDGMDMVICAYDEDTHELTVAGAHRPLYLIREGELYDYKGARYSLGTNSERSKLIHNYTIPIQEGDMVYMFSDGFPDQFGGPDKRKYMVGKLKKLFVKISTLPLPEQNKVLEKTFEKWRGTQTQTDDVLIIGIRF